MLAPFRAAPVKMRPNTGPAHGAHKNPVATPSRNEGSIAAPCAPTELESLAPKFTSGRMARSARLGKMSVNPNAARTATAMVRPYWFASTAHPPATTANVAIAANVTAMPTNIGRPLFAKERSTRANTNGSTGRIQGLAMVRTPPRKANTNKVIVALPTCGMNCFSFAYVCDDYLSMYLETVDSALILPLHTPVIAGRAAAQ